MFLFENYLEFIHPVTKQKLIFNLANANYFVTKDAGVSIHYTTGNDGVYYCMDESKAADVGYMSEIESENNSESVKVMEPKEDIAADIFIKTVTPYKITFNKKNDKEVATVMFLCRDDFDKLFIIDRNIIVKDEDHRAELECIPFAEDNEFDFGFCNALYKFFVTGVTVFILEVEVVEPVHPSAIFLLALLK